jgi:hypothetical protein
MFRNFNAVIWLMATLLLYVLAIAGYVALAAVDEGTAGGPFVVALSWVGQFFALPFAWMPGFLGFGGFPFLFGYLFDVALYGLIVERFIWYMKKVK